MKYREIPVIIEAVQWNKDGDHPNVITIPKEILEMESRSIIMQHTCDQLENGGWIGTLEGGHIVSPGDWIITGVKGEQYPCKPDIFAITYELVEGAAQ